MKMCKCDLRTIDFDNIDVYDVESFDNNILFVLLPVSMGVPSTYDRSVDGMDKMCDDHP